MIKYSADYTYIESDGVKLFTVILLPDSSGKFPVVVFRNPYVDIYENWDEADIAISYLNDLKRWLKKGYAVVFQHCRGRGKSTGDCIPYINEREDGIALLEWIRKQTFYNGEIFLHGHSYSSSVHYTTAPFKDDIKGAVFGAQDSERYNICYRNGFLKKALHGFKMGDFSEEYAETLKNQLGESKVAILGSYINPSNPNDSELETDIAKFFEKIKYASILKPIAVGTETGIYKEGLTDSEEAYNRVLQTMKKIVAEAEKYDVNVGIEGVCWFVINTPKKMKRLVDDLNSDNVKVIFDPVNYLNGGNYENQDEMIEDMFNLLADKICVLHAKDFTVENGEFKMVKPAEGMLNYKLIFEKMKEHNLDIPVICEEINEEEAVAAFEKLENLRRI